MSNHKLSIFLVLVIVLILFPTGLINSAEISSTTKYFTANNFVSVTEGSPVSMEVIERNTSVELSVNIKEITMNSEQGGISWLISNEGICDSQDTPGLPSIGRWVRVPDYGRIGLNYHAGDQRIVKGEPPAMDSDNNGIFPPESVVMGSPVIMRGVRLVSLTLYPVRWDAAAGEYIITEEFDISIRNIGGRGINEVEPLDRQPSQGFDRMIDALLVNPPRRDDPVDYTPGGYLLVANENYPDAIDEFAEWKRSVGHPVEILTFNPEDTDELGLKEMIQETYQDFTFEFLVLFGNEDADPPLRIPFQVGWNDCFYDQFFAQLEGDDAFPDAAVGSFNCMTVPNLICAVRRAISYQSQPYNDDEDWFSRAGVGVGACSVQNDLSPSYTGKWVTEVLSRYGFDDISTSYYADNEVDDPTPMVRDLYNEGCNFILVRAHQSNFDADDIRPTGVYPFHFLVSSGTLSGAFNRAFRMGTPDDMRGPSAGFGHAGSPRTNIANAMAGGLIEGMFLFDMNCFGWARNYAIANLRRVMPSEDDEDDDLYHYYYTLRYYGDPGQWCWRGVPQQLEVEYDNSFDPDQTIFPVRVLDSDNDEPVAGALVCLMQEDGINLLSRTDDEGWVNFTFESGDMNENDLRITVTGENLYPYSETIESNNADVLFVPEEIELNDEAEGNGNGIPNAGETLFVSLSLFNRGEERYPNDMVNPDQVHLFSSSPWAEATGEVRMPEAIEPNQAFQIQNGVSIQILEGCPDGEQIDLNLWIGSGVNAGWNTGFSIEVEAPDIQITVVNFEDDLEPGAEAQFTINLTNNGHQDADETRARIVSRSGFISVLAGISHYPAIPIDEEVEQDGDHFAVRATEETIPGSEAEFMLIVNGEPGVRDTLRFSLTVGETGEGDPLGPDKYGYVALDNTDENIAWAEAPEYDFLDINHWNGEIEGDLLALPNVGEDDASVLVDLPFEFRYYGEVFNQITVCSNGWIAMGDQSELVNQQNWVMPGFDGAFGMIAVFWDRLDRYTRSDGAFTYFDADNNIFYIMWETGIRVDYEGDWMPNIFELALFDPGHYETPTGDGQILMQYETVNNTQDQSEANAHCTVGISSPDGLDGLTYTYWGNYPPECAQLQAGRAILWTTIAYTPERGSISGIVTRFIDEAPVAGAIVSTTNGAEIQTDDEGVYVLPEVTAGMFDVTVTAEGYGEAVEEDVELEINEELEVNFVLPHGWLVPDPDSIYIEIEGNGRDDPFTLSNQGNIPLVYLYILECPFIVCEPDEGIIEPNDNTEIGLTIDPSYEFEQDHYEYEFIIENNTPVNPVIVPLIVDVLSISECEPEIPDEFVLMEPYPNPFNSATTIRFGVPFNSQVDVQLFDLGGRRITDIASGHYRTGWHRAVIDGSGLSTGLYFVIMEADKFRSIKRLLLIR